MVPKHGRVCHLGPQTPKMHIQVLELGTWYVTGPNRSRLDPFVDVAVHAGTSDAITAPKLGSVPFRSLNF